MGRGEGWVAVYCWGVGGEGWGACGGGEGGYGEGWTVGGAYLKVTVKRWFAGLGMSMFLDTIVNE